MSHVVNYENQEQFIFSNNKYKQKIWMEILLKYGSVNLTNLASLLDESETNLVKVLKGVEFLTEKSSSYLTQLFLLFLTN